LGALRYLEKSCIEKVESGSMTFQIIAVHLLLAGLLFFAINWLGKYSTAFGYKQLSLLFEPDEAPAFNLIFRIVTPVVFLLLSSMTFYALHLDYLNKGLYLVIIYYFAFRLSYNVLSGRSRLLNWPLQFTYVISTTGLACLAQKYLVAKKEFLFPNLETLGNQLWLLIIGFMYVLLNSVRSSPAKTIKRKNAYLNHRYKLYKEKYGEELSSIIKVPRLEAIVYAIMIYEAFNRPKAARILEAAGFYLGLCRTLGIMQMTTDKFITDLESVRLASTKILNDALSARDEITRKDYSGFASMNEAALSEMKEQNLINAILKQYNGGKFYAGEVLGLFRQIQTRFYADSQHILTALPCSESTEAAEQVSPDRNSKS
jgi:hypothetical protein